MRSRCSAESWVSCSSCALPRMPFAGFRTSWQRKDRYCCGGSGALGHETGVRSPAAGRAGAYVPQFDVALHPGVGQLGEKKLDAGAPLLSPAEVHNVERYLVVALQEVGSGFSNDEAGHDLKGRQQRCTTRKESQTLDHVGERVGPKRHPEERRREKGRNEHIHGVSDVLCVGRAPGPGRA